MLVCPCRVRCWSGGRRSSRSWPGRCRPRGGRGAVVFLLGEAGIGKSRLVHEVVALATGKSIPILRGRASPGSGGTAFRPLAEALASAVADRDLPAGELAASLPALAAIV